MFPPKVFHKQFLPLSKELKIKVYTEYIILEDEFYGDEYYFSKAVMNIYNKISEKEQEELFPLLMEICIVNNWTKELKEFIEGQTVREEYLHLLASFYFRNNDINQLKRIHDELCEKTDEFSVRLRKFVDILLCHVKREFSVMKPKYDEYFELIKDVPYEEYSRDMILIFNNYLYFLANMSLLDEFREKLQILKLIAEHTSDPYILTGYYNLVGSDAIRSGKYKEAEQAFRSGLELVTKNNYRLGIFSMQHNLAIVLYVQGLVEEAKAIFLEALAMVDNEVHQFQLLSNLGEIDLFMGNYAEAEKSFIESLEIGEKLNIKNPDTCSLLALTYIFIEDRDSALRALAKAEECLEKSSTQLSNSIFNYVQGMFYHIIEKNKGKAKEYFEICLDLSFKNNIFEYILRSEIQLTAIALESFGENKNVNYYTQILYHLENLNQLAQEQGLPMVEIEVQLLLYVTHILNQDKEKARQAIDNAKLIASESGLDKYSKLLNNISHEGSEIISSSLSRIRKIKVIQRSTTSRSKIFGVLITSLDNALIHYSRTLVEQEEFAVLASGLISAVQVMEKSIFGEEGVMKSFTLENNTLFMEKLENSLIILVIDHDSFNARTKFRIFHSKLRESIGSDYFKQDLESIPPKPEIDEIVKEAFPELR